MPGSRLHPLSSFGWSLAGVLAIALSLPPVGFFPLAWVGFVPILCRWATRRPSLQTVNEFYALFLTLASCSGFWLVLHPDPKTAMMGWLGLLLVPIPLVGAFSLGLLVKARFGLAAGLVSLVCLVLTGEYVMLHLPHGVPWLLLAHTQVEAIPFLPIAELGGVGVLTLWILLLNVFGFLVVTPSVREPKGVSERGLAAAVFAALLVLPTAYGAVSPTQTVAPAGYARLGLVQPGADAYTWDRLDPAEKVRQMAGLSDDLIAQWRQASRPGPQGDSLRAASVVPRPRHAGQALGVLVWPYGAIPALRDSLEEQRLIERLSWWSARRDVALLAGTFWMPESTREETPPASALLVGAGADVQHYQQMRRVALADRSGPNGSSRTLLSTGGVRIGTLLGYESLYGDHVRQFVDGGADLLVVLPQNGGWGRAGGTAEHLHLTRLRAVETQRAIVIASVSGPSAVVHPNGRVERIAGWGQEKTVQLDVPTYRVQTLYSQYGDWPGRYALVLSVLLHLSFGLVARYVPKTRKKSARPRVGARASATA